MKVISSESNNQRKQIKMQRILGCGKWWTAPQFLIDRITCPIRCIRIPGLIPGPVFSDPVIQIFCKGFYVTVVCHISVSIKVVPFFSDLAPAVGGIGVVFVDETPFGAHFFPGTVVTVPCIFQGKNIGFRACGPGAVLAAGGGDGADSEGVGTSVVYIVREIVGGPFGIYRCNSLSIVFSGRLRSCHCLPHCPRPHFHRSRKGQ